MKYSSLIKASLLSVIFVCISAQAQSKKSPAGSSYEEPWGMGGCGFASMFIKDKSKWAQVATSAINLYFSGYTNSSAISTGSSNCVESRSKVAQNEQKVFITVNLSSLSKEAAQGDGEHIAALAEVFGCPQDEFAKLSQTHYTSIYKTNEPNAVYENYRKEVIADQNLVKSCMRVI